ncbi:hypothetical protein GCM10010182_40950 [Actinomadura cremea]|nr:hypothetical protein GCM10010182_40950 [Actinomadura cremea]
MTRASQAAARLQHVRKVAEQHGTALKQAFALLQSGALVGPAGDRLHKTLANSHHDVRASFFAAFDAVQRVAAESGPPPRVPEPHIPGAPGGGPRAASGVRSGSPSGLHQLAGEVSRTAKSWRDAAGSISHVLGGLGLSTAPAQAISRAADRVAAERADLERRRDELVEDERRRLVQAAAGSAQAALTEKRGLTDVLGKAFSDTWNMYTGRYLAGVWEGTKDIGLFALATTPFTAPLYFGLDRDGWMTRGPIGQVQSLYYGVQHPTEFAKAAVNWEGWKEDPVRAYGEAVPNAVMFALNGGSGSTSGLAARIQSAVERARQGGKSAQQTPAPQSPNGAQEPPESSTSPPDPDHSSTAPAPISLEARAAQLGREIKQLPKGSGKPDRLAEAITRLRLSHDDSVKTAIRASEEAFGEVGGTAPAVGGGTVILPKFASQKIVIIVRDDGSVIAARGEVMDFIALGKKK